MKVAIGILLLTLGIGYMLRKLDRSGDPRLEPSSDLGRLGPPPPTDPATCISLVSYKGAVDENSTDISGSVKNACDYRYRFAQITFKLLDASGRVVGTAVANQSSLGGGQMWNFKAHGSVPASRFKFDHISAMPQMISAVLSN